MNAIILAAGFGSRLQPMTLNKPKPLLEVRGVSLLENMIGYLRRGGIEDIVVVTGYKSELFTPLASKLGFTQRIFKDYATCNSSQSLLFAKDKIQKGSIILNGDLYIQSDFCKLFKAGVSQFLAQKIPPNESAWGYITDCNFKILDIDLHATEGYADGIACFDNARDIEIFKEKLEQCAKDEYWEYAVLRSLESVNYYAFFNDDLYAEIDSFHDALKHNLLTPEEIAIQCSSNAKAKRLAGITNINYLIDFNNEQKVIRIPGLNTEKIIDRESEKAILDIIAPLDIAPQSEFYNSGIKMTTFLHDFCVLQENELDSKTLKLLASKLSTLHALKHKDYKSFQPIKIMKEIRKYENLAKIPLTMPREHKYLLDVARRLDSLESVLCHRDLQLPNILYNGRDIKLIDFEYAGFGCVEWELGNLSAELMLSRAQIEEFLGFYNELSTAHNGRSIGYRDVIDGAMCANYIWALWGFIYHRIDLARDYLTRFSENLRELNALGGFNAL